MTKEPFGELGADKDIPEWLISRPLAVGYFPGARLNFVFENLAEDARPEEYFDAARSFLELTVSDRCHATKHVYKNFSDFVAAVAAEDVDVQIDVPEDVWQHVSPTAIRVSRRHRRDKAVYVTIEAECDWEPEHGLQIVYCRGIELRRVSDQDGHLTHTDAYDLPEEEDRIS